MIREDLFNILFRPKDFECEILIMKMIKAGIPKKETREAVMGLIELYGYKRTERCANRIYRRIRG